jgi:hypothetical protein
MTIAKHPKIHYYTPDPEDRAAVDGCTLNGLWYRHGKNPYNSIWTPTEPAESQVVRVAYNQLYRYEFHRVTKPRHTTRKYLFKEGFISEMLNIFRGLAYLPYPRGCRTAADVERMEATRG